MLRFLLAGGSFAILSCLFACTSTPEPASAPTYASEDNGAGREACEAVKDIARVCYDESDPGTSCSLLRSTMVNEAARHDMRPSLQIQLGALCESACNQRKAGASWSSISGRANCNSI